MDPKELEQFKKIFEELIPPLIRQIVKEELQPTNDTVLKLSENYKAMEKFFQFAFEEAVGRVEKRDADVAGVIKQQACTDAAVAEIIKRLDALEDEWKDKKPIIEKLETKQGYKKIFIGAIYGAAGSGVFALIIAFWPEFIKTVKSIITTGGKTP